MEEPFHFQPMNNQFQKFLRLFLGALLTFSIWTVARAQTVEHSATSEIFSEPNAKLLITEVNFKNSHNDWVELYYESPTNQRFNLKGFQFEDDSVFKKIDHDYWLDSKQYYVLQFKNPGEDNEQNRTLFTTHTGLTATTEQIILKNSKGAIVDAVCWSNEKPTADEVKDMQKLFQNHGWNSANPSSCLSSEKIMTNQSIIRVNLNDSNSVNDWATTTIATLGQANVLSTSSNTTTNNTQTNETSTDSSSDDTTSESTSNTTNSTNTTASGDLENITKSNPNKTSASKPTKTSTTTKKASSKSTQKKLTASKKKTTTGSTTSSKSPAKKGNAKSSKIKKYKTGNLSANIMISEIFPHAAKDDRHNEWIELANTGDNSVNLGNWQLDDEEGGSKPYTLPDTINIPDHGTVVIKATDSKLSLGNLKDSVRLFDPTGKMVESVEYDQAPKDQSYSYVSILKEDGTSEHQWVWENKPTPGKPNPPYKELNGTITSEPQFGKTYSFNLKTADEQNHTIIFSEALIAGPLAQTTFRTGTKIKTIGVPASINLTDTQEKITPNGTEEQNTEEADLAPATTDQLLLKKFEVLQTPPAAATDQFSPWSLLGVVPTGGAGFWFLLKKIKKI